MVLAVRAGLRRACFWIAAGLASAVVSQHAFAQEVADPPPGAVTDVVVADQDPVAMAAPASPQVCDCPACNAADAMRPATPGSTCCRGQVIQWSKYPETIRPMPRPGIFMVPPSEGPAYFSAWDQVMGQPRQTRPRSGYAPFAINAWPFFDADWRYVESIAPQERTLVESLKRIHLNDCLMFSTGGEFWTRYENKHNVGLFTRENDFTLARVRLYGDLSYSDWLRCYGEYLWADSFGEDLPAAIPDVDRGDILDLFIDVKAFEFQGKPVYVRVGRQELLYGSQRLVTPLPWANKRHSFDGVKLFRTGETWDFDAFWTQFVPANASGFDTANPNLDFAARG